MGKILIIEDEQELLKVLAQKFAKENFSVLEATNGLEGFKAAIIEHPDVILLDILMPRMDGFTMLSNLRKDSWGATVPVIVLTNVGADSKITDAVIENQPAYYFLKSKTELKDIVDKVREILKI
jgi:DNA-binding response OmpR family regulator